ncbi:unnamed protein product [Phaedon cochleariae]|uniref:Fringe-like glycosyltransferase domain-containing protein n=1 Tax=Phaedon cochleariae TaxID=80249 RepID=A0A9N9SAT8_PHACE|nr:unnamed protein product [Phaedon cochleariae]
MSDVFGDQATGDFRAGSGQFVGAKMNPKGRKSLQILTGVLVFYSTLLLYQTIARGSEGEVLGSEKLSAKTHHRERNLAEDRSPIDEIPQEVTSEISASATATIKPPMTVLDDVFISVKTTKTYHNKRLPIILKTWFQLARKQV